MAGWEAVGWAVAAPVAVGSVAEDWVEADRSTAGAAAWRSSFAEQTAAVMAVADCVEVTGAVDLAVVKEAAAAAVARGAAMAVADSAAGKEEAAEAVGWVAAGLVAEKAAVGCS